MRDRIVGKGIVPDKVAVIPPWSHDNEVRFDAAGRERFRAAHQLTDKFVVMYAGNHSPVHPLDTLMQAAEQLRDEASVEFCFVGGGSEFKRVKRWAEEGKRANVRCLPYQPLNELSASLSAADAHVVVMGDGFVGLVHPCKIYNILAVSAPVLYIGPKSGHVPEIMDQLGGKYPFACAEHGEAEVLARHIQSFLRQDATSGTRRLTDECTAAFAKGALLPKLIAGLEDLRG